MAGGTTDRGARKGSERSLARALARVVNAGDGGARPETLGGSAAELLARGLVSVVPDGALVATPEGRARHARDAAGEAGFLAQHRALGRRRVETAAGATEVMVDLDESPLAWLARRKLLDPSAVLAGERLRADFTRAQMTPRVTANWQASVASGRRGAAGAGVEIADAVIAAKTRVARALDAVGPELAGALLDVCCFLKGLEEVERDRGWPKRGGKLVLSLGLASLARHYGYVAGGRAEGKIERWGAADSRPVIDGTP